MEYERQQELLKEEEERKKKFPPEAQKLVPALKRAQTRYEDEDGNEIYEDLDKVRPFGKMTPGVGNDEFFDEEAPLRANPSRKAADETWGDLKSGGDKSKLGGKKGEAKVTPMDSRIGNRYGRGNHSLVDDNDLE